MNTQNPGAPIWMSLFKHRNYALTMMTLVFVVNYMNRQIVNILLPQIKAEFHSTDAQLGILVGPTFAVVYAVLGLPLAMLADRVNRRNLIAITLALFSATTFISGYVSNFAELLLARFGTGVGEAGTSPAVSAMISDLFPPEKRATALGVYSGGLNIGLLVAFFGGGWLAQEYGWRDAFMLAGIPGLILVFLFIFTVSEPKRGHVDNMRDVAQAPGIWAAMEQLWAAIRHLASLRAFRWLVLGASLSAFAGYAGLSFNPSFLSRSHHLMPGEIGVLLALLNGIFGFLGTMGAGVIADRLGKKDMRWGMWVAMWGSILAVPFFPILYFSPSLPIAIAAMIVPFALSTTYMAPCFAAGQNLSPLRMRGKTQAIFLFTVNMIGLGLGPYWVGKVSDLLHPTFGEDSLRYAMVTTAIPLLASAFCFWQASRSVREDTALVLRGTHLP